MTTQTLSTTESKTLPVVFAMVLGVALLGLSGMAQATVLHDAAHDQRHAMAFPCH
jgi:cobalt transporter subunit CbtB